MHQLYSLCSISIARRIGAKVCEVFPLSNPFTNARTSNWPSRQGANDLFHVPLVNWEKLEAKNDHQIDMQ